MVLIAATVVTKSGKPLVTRQYVADMSRARLEGLIDAIPKLIGSGGGGGGAIGGSSGKGGGGSLSSKSGGGKQSSSDKQQSHRQHTFVETDSVRYVYQPLDSIYMVLVTTKASNILEDLETLRLFARVLPEYCSAGGGKSGGIGGVSGGGGGGLDEAEIVDKAFDLIFAFDEIVVLGYRESVNLAQIRTYTEMDSHEERVFNQIQIAQQRAANNAMNEKVKEMRRAEKQRKNLLRQGLTATQVAAIAAATGGGISAYASSGPTTVSAYASSDFGTGAMSTTSRMASKGPVGGGKALKLGVKANADENSFLAQLRQEGTEVSSRESKLKMPSEAGSAAAMAAADDLSSISKSPINFKCVERINATATRDGALEAGELLGSVSLVVTDPKYQTVAVRVRQGDWAAIGASATHLQVHPNLDKKVWQANSLLRLKSEQKPYPLGVDVGVLKWRVQLPNEEALPLALNCWPNEAPDGCVVNIEYTLQREELQLQNVTIIIPLPPATAPVVAECDGSYEYQKSKSQLVWTVDVIEAKVNKTGTLEFSTPNGHGDHFFPVMVRFHSEQLYCPVAIDGVEEMAGGASIDDYSVETRLLSEKYEIV